MGRILRWTWIALAGLAGAALLLAIYVYAASGRAMGKRYQVAAERLVQPRPQQLADAPRQSRILGCVSCHGEGLRGQKAFPMPGAVGEPWAPNLPLLAKTVSDQQLAAAIRQGVGHDGRGLYIMPSNQYSRLSDGEVAALIAYMRSLPVTGEQVPDLSWGPVGRFFLAKGDLKSMPGKIEAFRTNWPYQLGPEHARGREIAAKSCSDCHGPDLTGARLENGMVSPDLSIAGAYDLDQFRTLLRAGEAPGGKKLGLMAQAARGDLKYLTDAEIGSVHAYLKARAERVAR